MRLKTPLRVVAGVYLAGLLVQLFLRVKFPWDLFLWPESPFMTDMLKLHHGQPIYSPPLDGNSFVYSPGLQYLTFAVLRPFQAHLDIRFCRAITVLIGLSAALLASAMVSSVIERVRRIGLGTADCFFSAALAALLIFRGNTGDVPHPDNLTIFHAVLVLLLSYEAMERRSLALAFAAVFSAGIGVLIKQPAALAVLAPISVFFAFRTFRTGWASALAVFGILVSVLALAALWRPEFAKFYTYDLLRAHTMYPFKIVLLLQHALVQLPLLVLAVFGLKLLRQTTEGRRYLGCWIATFVFCGLPHIASFLKTEGAANNLTILWLLLFLLAWPPLAAWFSDGNQRSSSRPARKIQTAAVAVFILAAVPLRFPPLSSCYDYCRRVQESVRHELDQGKRVLVAHGAMYAIQAGNFDVPLDRANSLFELRLGSHDRKSGFSARLNEKYYDTIYLTQDWWYGPELGRTIDANYKEIDRFMYADHQPSHFGFQGLMTVLRIMVPRWLQAGRCRKRLSELPRSARHVSSGL